MTYYTSSQNQRTSRSFYIVKRRSKNDWAGCGIGDAFKSSIEFPFRVKAQRDYYRQVKAGQKEIAKITDKELGNDFEPYVKAQLSPLYTDYPSSLAAFASIGLTCFLEYDSRIGHNPILDYLGSFLENPAEIDGVDVDTEEYKHVIKTVCKWVWTRLILEDLAFSALYLPIEIYKLFSSAQENLRFSCLSEIVRAVILFGDTLPPWELLSLHPLTRDIVKKMTMVSTPYFAAINEVKKDKLFKLGVQWTRDVSKSLAEFLPPPNPMKIDKPVNDESSLFDADYEIPSFLRRRIKERSPRQKELYRKYLSRPEDSKENPNPDKAFKPLNGPNPPALDKPGNLTQHIVNAMEGNDEKRLSSMGNDPLSAELNKSSVINDFNRAIHKAGGQVNDWEDMRHDILRNILRGLPFEAGPVEGMPADGHEVILKMGKDLEAGGEIYDQPAELSDDIDAIQRLSGEARLITQQLKRNLYPNVTTLPVTKQIQTGGLLDNRRLALANVSSTIFKRYQHLEVKDRRGRPLLLIACDGSSSLDEKQMHMVKLLCTSYIESTVKSQIQIMAALYHSGKVKNGARSPLIRWIFHPQKSPLASRKEGVRAVAALPESGGTGVQSDALSLSFLLDEGKRIARGNLIYLVLITDAAWNRSFNIEKTGEEEVRFVLEKAYDELAGKLNVTLIALGVTGKTGLDDLVQKTITVSEKELSDTIQVAQKIALYVASCIKERKNLISD
jgi:hypothetical protein